MSNISLTLNEIDVILESLKYTVLAFENYQGYPSFEFKQTRIKEVNDVALKLRDMRIEING
jgi:hypothetical protein